MTYKELVITPGDVEKFVEYVTEVDELTEELRVREQEIFAYTGTEEKLKLQLMLSKTNCEIMKLLRAYIRSAKVEEEKTEVKENDKDKK